MNVSEQADAAAWRHPAHWLAVTMLLVSRCDVDAAVRAAVADSGLAALAAGDQVEAAAAACLVEPSGAAFACRVWACAVVAMSDQDMRSS